MLICNSLTEREIEFCEEFIRAKGRKGWQNVVAATMGISEKTVDSHKNSSFQTLLVNNVTELMYLLLTTKEWRYTKWDKLRIKNLKKNT